MIRMMLVAVLLCSPFVAVNAQRLYAIAFADSGQSDNEQKRYEHNLHSFRVLANEVAIDLDYDITVVSYVGDKYTKKCFDEAINGLSLDADDIAIFAYFGHGLRSKDDISEYPQITFNSSDEKEFVPLENIKTMLVNKGARFVLVVGECGNSESQTVTSKRLISLKHHRGRSQTSGKNKENMFTQQGYIIVSASSKGETILCGNSEGSLFAQSFFNNCTKYVKDGFWRDSEPSWAWRDILRNTKDDVTYKSKMVVKDKKLTQTPVFEINIH